MREGAAPRAIDRSPGSLGIEGFPDRLFAAMEGGHSRKAIRVEAKMTETIFRGKVTTIAKQRAGCPRTALQVDNVIS